jgi:hypothetical protein
MVLLRNRKARRRFLETQQWTHEPTLLPRETPPAAPDSCKHTLDQITVFTAPELGNDDQVTFHHCTCGAFINPWPLMSPNFRVAEKYIGNAVRSILISDRHIVNRPCYHDE